MASEVVDKPLSGKEKDSKLRKTRDSSRDPSRELSLEARLSAMEDRLGKLELTLTESFEKVNTCFHALNDLEADMKSMVNVLKGEMKGFVGALKAETTEKVPEPNSYKGTRDAKELENYLWQMEQDFRASKIDDEEVKVSTAAMYLTDDAMLWWRRRYGDVAQGLCSVKTWEDFKREIKA
ncbi:hypothetical protein AMTR_s00011p00232440 [Amborella trichopoda]|uniref:Retrotransposon gag domain-containing protein n=1 Tax=Amborella trichopoda TaxID=13333 RepID=W1NHQ5_AMBTC|nr:hypothetical protein AMTR_s00011p00232440 [Amborella trichopoda]